MSTSTIMYRCLKIVRSAYDREQNPDRYDPVHLTPEQVGQINTLLLDASPRATELTHAEIIRRTENPANHVLAAFEGSAMETARVVALATLTKVETLTSCVARLGEVVCESDQAYAPVIRELVRRQLDHAEQAGFPKVESDQSLYRRLTGDLLPEAHTRRMSVDIDITER